MPWTKVVADRNEMCSEKDDASADMRILSYGEAITEAIGQAMQLDKRVVLLGEGIDAAGYIYNTTAGLGQKYGNERVIETPIAEAALTGMSLGMAITGLRPVLIHMRNDFLLVSMDQIVNHIAHWKTVFGQDTPLVIRAIIARGWGSGAQHSQSFQSLFAGLDGVDVLMPATPYDVKGMFLGAVASARPVIFLEHRWLYGDKGTVPAEPYLIGSGRATIRNEGKDGTVLAMSLSNREVGQAVHELKEEGYEIEWIDLRSIHPWDVETVTNSLKKTGRVLVVENGPLRCGVGAEIASFLSEHCWEFLKAPIKRLGWPGNTVPSGTKLEEKFYPTVTDIKEAVRKLVEYK